jgi:hypothetical protein
VTIFPERDDDLADHPDVNLTRGTKAIQVIGRFCLRMAILTVFAAFGNIGFARSMTVLLGMSAVLSGALATVKREQMLGTSLSHWDEMAVYAALACLLAGFDVNSLPT